MLILKREWMVIDYWNLLRYETFDIAKIFTFFPITKRYCRSLGTRSSCPSDTMHIGLSNIRYLIIDHVFELIDIDPTSRDIRRDENTSGLCLEVREGSLTSVLSLVPVYCLSDNPMFREHADDLVSSMFGPGKDEDGLDILILEEVFEEVILIEAIDIVDLLLDHFDGRRDRSDGHFRWFLENRLSELHNLRRHRR